MPTGRRRLTALVSAGAVLVVATGALVGLGPLVARPPAPVASSYPGTAYEGPAYAADPPPVGPPVPSSVGRDLAASLAARSLPRFSPPITDLPGLRGPEWPRDRCLNVSARNAAQCVYAAPGAIREVALLGDSVALSWLPGLRVLGQEQGWRIHVLTQQQCPTADVRTFLSQPAVANATCDEHRRWAMDQVRRLRPALVIASSSSEGPDHLLPGMGPGWPARWTAGLTSALRDAAGSSARVVVLAPPPPTPDLARCAGRSGTPAGCTGVVSAGWRTLYRAEDAAVRAAGPRVEHVDTRAWFCLRGRCPAFVGVTPVSVDGRHLTAAYSRRLVPELADRLAG